MLATRALTKRFGLHVAVSDLHLSVARGSCLAIFGPNGAGKTTLLKLLAFLVKPTSGEILFGGERGEAGELRQRIGFLSHQPLLYKHLTAYENLKFYARLYGLTSARKRAREVLAAVGLEDRADEPVQGFSYGMLQRAAVARALLHEPELLLLDEPFSGLDSQGARDLMAILEGLRDGARTLILTTHDIHRGLALCDEAGILIRGRLAYRASRAELGSEENFVSLYEAHSEKA